MNNRLIALTTDFGEGSPYVAQMKAAALSVNSQLSLLDVTHSIGPQDVRHGALVLAEAAPCFPAGTIHVCVVDPGVGTHRKIMYAKIGDQHFIAPDNGVLSLVARRQPPDTMVAISRPDFWRRPVSATFHGRDIMAPVAAHVALGVEPRRLGPRLAGLVQLDWPEVDRQPCALVGSVVLVDHFGNLITNITREMLPAELAAEKLNVKCGAHEQCAVVETYGQARRGMAVALFGSSDRLEVAVTNGSAARTLGCDVGDSVQVTWPPR